MAGKTIFLILALFMGVSVAYGPPGLFRDRTAPDKWSTLRKMKDERNQPERRKLPYRGTGMTFVKDEAVEYVDYCHKITRKNVKVEDTFSRWTYTGTVKEDTRCAPYNDDGDLQPCNSDSNYNLYCHTVEIEEKVKMDCVGRCPKQPWIMKREFTLKVGVGCECRKREPKPPMLRKRQKFGDDAAS